MPIYDYFELISERVSATRTFDHRGVMSLTVTEGEKLQIYCDIHGVNSSDFEGSNPKVELKWTKGMNIKGQLCKYAS